MEIDFIKSLKIKCKCNNYMDFSLKSRYGCEIVIIYCKNCDNEEDFFIKYLYSLDLKKDKVLVNLFKNEFDTFYGFVYHKQITVIDKNDILINDWESFKKILLLQDRQKIKEKYEQYVLFM